MTSKTSLSEAQARPGKARGNEAAGAAHDAGLDAPSGAATDARSVNPGPEAPMVAPPTDNPADIRPGSAKRGPMISTNPPDAVPTPSKLSRLLDLLRRPEGATLAEMRAATGWQAHSLRGAMAGALKRKGHIISSDKHDGQRRYRAGAAS